MKDHVLFYCLSLCCFVVFLVGCNRSPIPGLVSGEGKIFLDGMPIGGVSIVFTPKDSSKNAYYSTTVSKADGSFELNTIGYKGIQSGVYNVILSKQTLVSKITEAEEKKLVAANKDLPEPDIIYHVPAKYESFQTSGIVVEIAPKGNKDIRIELKSDKSAKIVPDRNMMLSAT